MNGMMLALTELQVQAQSLASGDRLHVRSNSTSSDSFQNVFQLVQGELEDLPTLHKGLINDEALQLALDDFLEIGNMENDLLHIEELIQQLDNNGEESLFQQFENLMQKLDGVDLEKDNQDDELFVPTAIQLVTEQPVVEALKIERLITTLKEQFHLLELGTDVKTIAPQLLALLKESTLLLEEEQIQLQEIATQELEEKDAEIWKQLTQIYENRSKLSQNGQYESNATITRTELANLLQQAITRYQEPVTHQAQIFERYSSPVVTMSAQEQYVIHMNGLDRIEQISDQLMTQFTNVLKMSKFTQTDLKELTITLRPEQLGNMVVRLTQVDDEIIVRIIVSSLATKGILEANVDKLKHMFLPHQVIIERDESVIDEQVVNDQPEDEHLEENNSSQEEQDHGQDKEQDNELDFQAIFEQFQVAGWERE